MSKPPFQLARIDHVVLRVRDTEAMQRFYCEVLGCREERRQDEIGLVQLRAGDSLIDLVALDSKLGRLGGAGPGEQGHNMDHLCLQVENYDEAAIVAHPRRMACAWGTSVRAMGRRARGRRSTCMTRRGTWWS